MHGKAHKFKKLYLTTYALAYYESEYAVVLNVYNLYFLTI